MTGTDVPSARIPPPGDPPRSLSRLRTFTRNLVRRSRATVRWGLLAADWLERGIWHGMCNFPKAQEGLLSPCWVAVAPCGRSRWPWPQPHARTNMSTPRLCRVMNSMYVPLARLSGGATMMRASDP